MAPSAPFTRANLHILATMRSKTEYVVETNDRGKATPRKVGMAPIQREGVEYEFDLFGEMDQENTLVIHKSRCPALSGAVIARPGPAVARTLQAWLSGAPIPSGSSNQSAVPLRIRASVAPVAGSAELNAEDAEETQRTRRMEGGQNEDERQGSVENGEGARASTAVDASKSTAASPETVSPSPTIGPRKSLTERARELGYEGEAWMALVYRLTGKREPRELTSQDKTKLAVYLGHLAKLASRPQIVREDAAEDGSFHQDSDTRKGKRGA